MPFITALFAGLVSLLPQLVWKVLGAVGIGLVTYQGAKAALDVLKASVVSQIGGMSADVLNLIALLQVDKAITVLFSAIVVRWTFAGMKAATGAITKVGPVAGGSGGA